MENRNILYSNQIHRKLENIALKYSLADENEQITTIELKELNTKVNHLFFELYTKSISDNYIWQYCPFDIWKVYFEQRYNEFKKKNIDTPKTDFLIQELECLFENTTRQKQEKKMLFKCCPDQRNQTYKTL